MSRQETCKYAKFELQKTAKCQDKKPAWQQPLLEALLPPCLARKHSEKKQLTEDLGRKCKMSFVHLVSTVFAWEDKYFTWLVCCLVITNISPA